jgi:hypothetical protein
MDGVAGEGKNSIAQSWKSSSAAKERFRCCGTLPVNAYLRLLGCVVRRAPSRRLSRVFRIVSIAEAAARPLDELSHLKEYVGSKEFGGHGHTEAL